MLLKRKITTLIILVLPLLALLFGQLVLSPQLSAEDLGDLEGAFGQGAPVGTRCAVESIDSDRVIEGSCEGYSLDRSTPYPFEPNKCYYIKTLNNGPPDWDIDEIDCNEFDSYIRLPAGATGSVDGDELIENADCKVDPSEELDSQNCRIVYWINLAINILSVMVGIVVTAMIIFGGIQYTAAGGDPNAVAKAKKHIFNAIFALVAFGLMYAFLQYVIPGGTF